ncbi:tigger transposable element-derived protein 4-like [Branchiostoma lanceolatum]|uniref:tigger transposable element-derived protein 4-like n=1 Tax=Branchiostoma lanceolatum TaxID=7740 RepID=UPI0034544888
MAKAPGPGRTSLTLQQKVEVIRLSENAKKSSRQLAADFGVGRTQIQSILKHKREHLEDFENNAPSTKKRNVRQTGNEAVNKLVWEFFVDTRKRGLTACSGPMLQEAARKFAAELGVSEFKASNGWLESFKRRHNIVGGTVVGESASVSNATVEEWKDKLAQITRGYAPEDLYNMDETGLFFRATTTKTLCVKGEQCSGGKQSKERVTVMLCSNMAGDKEKPLLIGKSTNPRCFKNIKKSSLPVTYDNNKKAWMTSAIFADWIKTLDKKMKRQDRKIVLFMDNAPTHIGMDLSNIELKFFPPNTTSRLQPMDQGIIQAMKLKYRKLQLNRIVNELQENRDATGTDIAKKITVLDAIRWVDSAWKETGRDTIKRCFEKSGFTTSSPVAAVDTEPEVEDEATEMDSLAEELFGCSVEELATIDEDLATCDTTGRDWSLPASTILEQLEEEERDEDHDEDIEDSTDDSTDECAAKDFSTCVDMLKQIKGFCLKEGDGETHGMAHNLEDALYALWSRNRASRQTTMVEYFTKV